MASVGRGEFFRSLLEGLERKPAQCVPVKEQHVGGRGRLGLREGGAGRRKKNQVRGLPRAASQREPRLPYEILVKILSYLDAASLLCLSHVSKLFHHLANDNALWQKIYMSEFGWKPKSVYDAAVKEELAVVEHRSAGCWKNMYFRMIAGHEMNKWRRELRDINPHTGLPRQTTWVLRNMNVRWKLTVRDQRGKESTLDQSQTCFCESSVIVRWSTGNFPLYHNINSIQLHGVTKETLNPGWRSLILKLETRFLRCQFIGKDKLIKLIHLSPGVIIGIWRGQSKVAFIMISLHFHRLVERSLLGTPVYPYFEPMDTPHVNNSDPEFGLHGYTLHFVLHNTSSEIMSGYFRHLSCSTGIRHGLVELNVINKTNLSQHRILSGSIKLPWKSNELEGSVENCCIMTLTLLDEFQKPFWCVSSPVTISRSKMQSMDYGGDDFQMEYHDSDGQVKMRLVWLKEQGQFFLTSLMLYMTVFKVNKHFGREYSS
ncbi:F-box only protein 15-like [Pholidichthys leucotaenia]